MIKLCRRFGVGLGWGLRVLSNHCHSLVFNISSYVEIYADLYIRGVSERFVDRIPLLRWKLSPDISTRGGVFGFVLIISTIGWRLILSVAAYLEQRRIF